MLGELIKQGAEDFYLAGVENSGGNGCRYNFIASNGKRTEQKSDQAMKDFMMPETIKQTRKVEVYCNACLQGFKFFDEKDNLLFGVGDFGNTMTSSLIAADEQIIGVKAKLYSTYQAVYTDFQFMVCKRLGV